MREELTRAVDTFRHFQERLIHGCHDRACVIEKTKGQVTNGGCNCLEDMTFMQRQYVGAMLRAAQDMADALESRPEAAQVRVKPLEWEEAQGEWLADCYRLQQIFNTGVWIVIAEDVELGRFVESENDFDLRQAKAAAQADYERRIRAALEPATKKEENNES